MFKPLLLSGIISSTAYVAQSQSLEDVGEISFTSDQVLDILNEAGKYNFRYGVSPQRDIFERGERIFEDDTIVAFPFGEFRYSSHVRSGGFSGNLHLDTDSIPDGVVQEGQDIPDFTISGEASGVISYVADRYDLVFSLYDYQKNTSSLRVGIGAGVSMYSFSLQGLADITGASLGQDMQASGYYSLHTSHPLINPAIIGEMDYSKYFLSGDRAQISLTGRGEMGNTEVSVIGSYDYSLGDSTFLQLSVGGVYHDYHTTLEQLDGFDDGWQAVGEIGFIWQESESQSLAVSYDNAGEIHFSYEKEF